jgi:hypothetical protein
MKDMANSGNYSEDFAKDLYSMSDAEIQREYERLSKQKDKQITGHEGYIRIAGEVEARNASRRMNMTAEEKRASLLEETEDVAREDQIFLRKNLGADARQYSAGIEESRETGKPKPKFEDFGGDVVAFTKAINEWNLENNNGNFAAETEDDEMPHFQSVARNKDEDDKREAELKKFRRANGWRA